VHKQTSLSRLLTLSLLLLLLLQTPIKDSQAASKAILALDGVVDHGLFLDMVDVCIIAGSNGVEVKERQ
jgi:ribose 5-phosphate isomerase A